MNIDFIGQINLLPDCCLTRLEQLLQFTVQTENIANEIEMTVSFVSNNDIQQLNKQFRNKNESTDVLSFPLYSKEELQTLDQTFPISLGDVVISIERAERQAVEYNHTFEREICFLAVHGLLHLLGYDHLTKGEEEIMFTKQNRILKEYGIER